MSFFNGDFLISNLEGLVFSNLASDVTPDPGYGSFYVNGGELKFKIGSESIKNFSTSSSSSSLDSLTDVKLGGTDFTDSFVIQTNVDGGSIVLNGTLSSATNNICFGYDALKNLTSGSSNIGINVRNFKGVNQITTGSNNITIGGGAGGEVSSGSDNIAIGWRAIDDLTTGIGNICIGHQSAKGNITTGSNNTLIGLETDVFNNSNNYDVSNQIAIGAYTKGPIVNITGSDANPQNNTIAYIGHDNISRLYANSDGSATLYGAGEVSPSDRRIKENINNIEFGLNFLNNINPVTYNDKQPQEYDDDLKNELKTNNKEPDVVYPDSKIEKLNFGLIAQNVDEELKKMNISDNNNIVYIDDNTSFHRLKYCKLIPILIKGIKELNNIIDDQERELNLLLNS